MRTWCKACGKAFENRSENDWAMCPRCIRGVTSDNQALVDPQSVAAGKEQRRAERALKARRQLLESKYGITLEQYETMNEAQAGLCLICQAEWHRPLFVDHDHSSGAVRGLLCGPCNAGIGLLKDDPDAMRRAADYVERSTVGASTKDQCLDKILAA